MTALLTRLFVKNSRDVKNPAVRHAYGTLSGLVGILLNLILSAIKLLAGLLSGSIAITADALNNLSDAGSQVITLISFKIASKPADRDHPFGHARMEYIASMIVSFLILMVGVELFRESLRGIFDPTSEAVFSNLTLIILAISILLKVWLFFFNRTIGKRIGSSVMIATAVDSISDAGATAAVLVSALISRFSGIRTDAYMGILVSFLILVAGIRILNETKNSLLGSAPDPEVIEGIERICSEHPELLGIHDMVVHNYGPGNTVASFHAEVDGSANVFDTHDVIDTVERRLWEELKVRATVHMDPIVTDDERVNALRAATAEAVRRIDERLTIHDFRFVEGPTHTNLIFDVCAPFELNMQEEELRARVAGEIAAIDPTYFVVITVDRQ